MIRSSEGAAWEALEVVAVLVGLGLVSGGALWIMQGLGVLRSGQRLSRTDRLVGGLVAVIFGVGILASYAWFDQ
jgi:hypothetical protein